MTKDTRKLRSRINDTRIFLNEEHHQEFYNIFNRLDHNTNKALTPVQLQVARNEIKIGPLKIAVLHQAMLFIRHNMTWNNPKLAKTQTRIFQRFIRGIIEDKIDYELVRDILQRLTKINTGIFNCKDGGKDMFSPGNGLMFLRKSVYIDPEDELGLWFFKTLGAEADKVKIPDEPYKIEYLELFSQAIDRGFQKAWEWEQSQSSN